MRIDDRLPIGSTQTREVGSRSAREVTTGSSTPASKVRQGDTAELSQRARDIQKVKDAVLDLPEVREDRVAEIRARLARGEYQVSAKDLANRMTDSVAGSGSSEG